MEQVYETKAFYTGVDSGHHFVFWMTNGGTLYAPKTDVRAMDIEPRPDQEMILRYKLSEGFSDPNCAGIELSG